MSNLTTWKIEITNAFDKKKESWADFAYCTLSNKELNEEFHRGFGTSEGKPFTLWTKKRVYFPVVYDGAEWVDSVPRNPCDEATDHVGGQ